MTKRLLLAIVCLLAISVTAGAQKRERKIKRIDRGVQEKVFIPKGQWLAGGSVSYSEHEEDNLNFLVLKDVEGKGYNFKVSPYVGYFFADNMAAGFRFAYNRTYLDMPTAGYSDCSTNCAYRMDIAQGRTLPVRVRSMTVHSKRQTTCKSVSLRA